METAGRGIKEGASVVVSLEGVVLSLDIHMGTTTKNEQGPVTKDTRILFLIESLCRLP